MLLGLVGRCVRWIRQIYRDRAVDYIDASRYGGWRRGE